MVINLATASLRPPASTEIARFLLPTIHVENTGQEVQR